MPSIVKTHIQTLWRHNSVMSHRRGKLHTFVLDKHSKLWFELPITVKIRAIYHHYREKRVNRDRLSLITKIWLLRCDSVCFPWKNCLLDRRQIGSLDSSLRWRNQIGAIYHLSREKVNFVLATLTLTLIWGRTKSAFALVSLICSTRLFIFCLLYRLNMKLVYDWHCSW